VEQVQGLWQYTNPNSNQLCLHAGAAAFRRSLGRVRHVARLADAFNKKPDDFVAFPAPAALPVAASCLLWPAVAIPKTSPDQDKAKALVAYMLKPETQIATLKATNFFPVVDVKYPTTCRPSVKPSARRSPP